MTGSYGISILLDWIEFHDPEIISARAVRVDLIMPSNSLREAASTLSDPATVVFRRLQLKAQDFYNPLPSRPAKSLDSNRCAHWPDDGRKHRARKDLANRTLNRALTNRTVV